MSTKRTKVFFGTRKEDSRRIYLELPTWDCDWYWSFGYLGNAKEHYHLSGYQSKQRFFTNEDGKLVVLTEKRNMCMRDCLLEDYNLNPLLIEDEHTLWTFCELALTAYQLKETAEVLGRGGSHMTTNPCENIIKDEDMVKKINTVMLPAVFKQIEKLFGL